jgi:hypothetical protein
MKLVAISLAVMLATGCASAEQRMASKADYRDSQVEAIKVQAEQATARQTNEYLAKAEMWKALSEAISNNPDSASHFAIVMAVAAARSNDDDSGSMPVVKIREERSTTALDVVKAVTPAVMGSLTQVGVAAIAAETLRNASDNSRQVRIAETEQDGKMWDVLGDAVNGDEPVDTTDVTEDVTDTTPDNTDETPADDVVDPSEDVVDPDEDVDEEEAVDCTPPLFSPTPPECAS